MYKAGQELFVVKREERVKLKSWSCITELGIWGKNWAFVGQKKHLSPVHPVPVHAHCPPDDCTACVLIFVACI